MGLSAASKALLKITGGVAKGIVSLPSKAIDHMERGLAARETARVADNTKLVANLGGFPSTKSIAKK